MPLSRLYSTGNTGTIVAIKHTCQKNCFLDYNPYRWKKWKFKKIALSTEMIRNKCHRATYSTTFDNHKLLEKRRKRDDLIEVFRNIKGIVCIDYKQFFTPGKSTYNLRRHNLNLAVSHSRLNVRKFFFSLRVVPEWNRLPQHVIDVIIVNQFKRRLDRWLDMGI